MKVKMPSPCKESWNSMTPKDNGKYCHQCKIVVVDFAHMTAEEIKTYLLSRPQPVCGRVFRRQVNRKENIFQRLLINSYYKTTRTTPGIFRKLVLLLLGPVMLITGCNAVGKMAPENEQEADTTQLRTVDTLSKKADTTATGKTLPGSDK